MIERKGLAIYFKNENGINTLDKNVMNVYYYSEKNLYAVVYFDKNREGQIISSLEKNPEIESFTDILSGVENYSF